MAKKASTADSELNLDSLMDAVTNVVGVLMIVLIMMALNTARMVQKILSDLPPVTEEQHKEMQEKVKELPPPPMDPEELAKKKKEAEDSMIKVTEQLKTIDTSTIESKMKFMDLDSFRKQLEERRKEREVVKEESDKLQDELERLKALLDETPVYQPPPPTYVRLPNPRAYPENAVETRVLVAKQGTLFLNTKEYLDPIVDGLEKVKSQLEYKEARYEPFAKMLEGIFANANQAKAAWPEMAPLIGNFQIDELAMAFKAVAESGVTPDRKVLESLGDISVVTRSTVDKVGKAVAAAMKGDVDPWKALDPSRDPLKPTIQASVIGDRLSFSWGAKAEEVKSNPKDVLKYFVDLAGADNIKGKGKDRTIYEAAKVAQMLERAAASPTISKTYGFVASFSPASTQVKLSLKPKSGGGETLEQMKDAASGYQRLLRAIKDDPSGVVIFQVMSDAFEAYLESRKIADDIGVPATWEFLGSLDLSLTIPGFAVQRTMVPKPPNPKGTIRIDAPKRKLD